MYIHLDVIKQITDIKLLLLHRNIETIPLRANKWFIVIRNVRVK